MNHNFYGRWIATEELEHSASYAPAPKFRKVFEVASVPVQAELLLASGGYHELYVNNIKADDRVLAPAPTQYSRRVRYINYNITHLLKPGTNEITVILGNGWYDPGTVTRWATEHVPWRERVRMCCDLFFDGKLQLISDKSWEWALTPIIFNELRNGEFYDGRLEESDAAWKKVEVVAAPAGVVELEQAPPCRITQWFEPVGMKKLNSYWFVYDFGINMSGVCELSVSGPAGAAVTLIYAESVKDTGDTDNSDFESFVLTGSFQQDKYILRGTGQAETFRPRFTYHGFRYVKVMIFDQAVKLHSIRAGFIHTDFRRAGSIASDNYVLNQLQKMTCQSYLSNFVGIPTDCPHREKNGWTGDALLAMECGLWNFDCTAGCKEFAATVLDTQRSNGQLAAVAPAGMFGYGKWAGPAWDSVIFEYAYQIYRFTGDTELIQSNFDAMKKYLDFCRSMSDETGLVEFGLGDWCHIEYEDIAPIRLTSSAFYCYDLDLMAFFARLIGQDGAEFDAMAGKIRQVLWKEFCANDRYLQLDMTALAALLYYRIVPENECQKLADRLLELLKKHEYTSYFGMLGAKWVPRVLADYGYADAALKLYTQENCPGWGYFVKNGDTTLCECWNRMASRNHILFGDISAWMYEYLGGVSPQKETPGFERFRFAPRFPAGVNEFNMEYASCRGIIKSSWQRSENGRTAVKLIVPSGSTAQVILPGMAERICPAGEYTFEICAAAGKE